MTAYEEIIRKIQEDPRNEDYTKRGVPPILQIHPESHILIIGQAPGRKVEESGILFNDKSGEKLRAWMGIGSTIFYSEKISVLPMDFYYPGKGKTGDLPPRSFIAAEYHPSLLRLMADIRLTILIGSYATKWYLRDRARRTLTDTVRDYASYLPDFFPIVHPSPLNFRWQAKNPWFEAEVVPELKCRVAAALRN